MRKVSVVEVAMDAMIELHAYMGKETTLNRPQSSSSLTLGWLH